jgi:hypothetical protein
VVRLIVIASARIIKADSSGGGVTVEYSTAATQ